MLRLSVKLSKFCLTYRIVGFIWNVQKANTLSKVMFSNKMSKVMFSNKIEMDFWDFHSIDKQLASSNPGYDKWKMTDLL